MTETAKFSLIWLQLTTLATLLSSEDIFHTCADLFCGLSQRNRRADKINWLRVHPLMTLADAESLISA